MKGKTWRPVPSPYCSHRSPPENTSIRTAGPLKESVVPVYIYLYVYMYKEISKDEYIYIYIYILYVYIQASTPLVEGRFKISVFLRWACADTR